MRPDDLLGRGHLRRGVRLRPVDGRAREDRLAELAPADLEDAAAPPDLLFLRRQRHRLVGLASCDVAQLPRERIEGELVAVLRVGDRFRALDDVQAEVEAVAAEDVAHVVAADDDHLQAGFLGDAFQPGRAHLARRSDREAIAGDDEVLAAVHARAEVGHQIAERSGLPALVEGLQALGDAVGRRRDLIGVDGVELLCELRPGKALGVPEDERAAGNQRRRRRVLVLERVDDGLVRRERANRHARLQPSRFNGVHTHSHASKTNGD